MALQNLTDAQERAINEAMVLFPDPLMRAAIAKAIDSVVGAYATGADVTAIEGNVTAVEGDVAALETSVANLNAWATALATKFNADAGVTDANYDTDPQA